MTIHCVVPTLNAAATLEQTLQSITQQQGVTLQLDLIDSASSDETLAIAQRYGVPPQFATPGNMYRAINAGLRPARSDWLTYLNADDLLNPDSYARLVAHGEATQADVVYGNCDYVNKQGELVYHFAAAQPDQLLRLFRTTRMGFAQPAAIFRRSLFEQLNGFDESYRYKADADFFLRALKQGSRFSKLPGRPVARFRLHSAQLSQSQADAIALEGKRLFSTLQPTLRDWVTVGAWQLRNAPNYGERVWRASWRAGRLRLPRTLEAYD